MNIVYASKFKKSLKKLPNFLVEKVVEKIILFENNFSHPSLDAHKLHGRLKNQWSFSIDKKHRALFEFDQDNVILLDVGDHDVYR
jgi:mRNA-degrading endonuclease YafQ of YafQ-DinJ toxin-antitoxin module